MGLCELLQGFEVSSVGGTHGFFAVGFKDDDLVPEPMFVIIEIHRQASVFGCLAVSVVVARKGQELPLGSLVSDQENHSGFSNCFRSLEFAEGSAPAAASRVVSRGGGERLALRGRSFA